MENSRKRKTRKRVSRHSRRPRRSRKSVEKTGGKNYRGKTLKKVKRKVRNKRTARRMKGGMQEPEPESVVPGNAATLSESELPTIKYLLAHCRKMNPLGDEPTYQLLEPYFAKQEAEAEGGAVVPITEEQKKFNRLVAKKLYHAIISLGDYVLYGKLDQIIIDISSEHTEYYQFLRRLCMNVRMTQGDINKVLRDRFDKYIQSLRHIEAVMRGGWGFDVRMREALILSQEECGNLMDEIFLICKILLNLHYDTGWRMIWDEELYGHSYENPFLCQPLSNIHSEIHSKVTPYYHIHDKNLLTLLKKKEIGLGNFTRMGALQHCHAINPDTPFHVKLSEEIKKYFPFKCHIIGIVPEVEKQELEVMIREAKRILQSNVYSILEPFFKWFNDFMEINCLCVIDGLYVMSDDLAEVLYGMNEYASRILRDEEPEREPLRAKFSRLVKSAGIPLTSSGFVDYQKILSESLFGTDDKIRNLRQAVFQLPLSPDIQGSIPGCEWEEQPNEEFRDIIKHFLPTDESKLKIHSFPISHFLEAVLPSITMKVPEQRE